jgi:hypothetical protein
LNLKVIGRGGRCCRAIVDRRMEQGLHDGIVPFVAKGFI